MAHNVSKYLKRNEEESYSNIQKGAVGTLSSECDPSLLVEAGRLFLFESCIQFLVPVLEDVHQRIWKGL